MPFSACAALAFCLYHCIVCCYTGVPYRPANSRFNAAVYLRLLLYRHHRTGQAGIGSFLRLRLLHAPDRSTRFAWRLRLASSRRHRLRFTAGWFIPACDSGVLICCIPSPRHYQAFLPSERGFPRSPPRHTTNRYRAATRRPRDAHTRALPYRFWLPFAALYRIPRAALCRYAAGSVSST